MYGVEEFRLTSDDPKTRKFPLPLPLPQPLPKGEDGERAASIISRSSGVGSRSISELGADSSEVSSEVEVTKVGPESRTEKSNSIASAVMSNMLLLVHYS